MVQVAAETPFSGRLELTTTSLEQATSFIKKSAWDNGLASLPPDETGGRVVCRIQGRREALESLLASLGTMGQLVKNARLIVDTDRFTVPVIIESVTFPQVAGLLSQATTPQRLQVAKEMAMLNQFAREIRGREMQLAADQKLGNAFAELATTPRPWLAQGRKPSDTTPLEGDVQGMASLTIVLLSAQ